MGATRESSRIRTLLIWYSVSWRRRHSSVSEDVLGVGDGWDDALDELDFLAIPFGDVPDNQTSVRAAGRLVICEITVAGDLCTDAPTESLKGAMLLYGPP